MVMVMDRRQDDYGHADANSQLRRTEEVVSPTMIKVEMFLDELDEGQTSNGYDSSSMDTKDSEELHLSHVVSSSDADGRTAASAHKAGPSTQHTNAQMIMKRVLYSCEQREFIKKAIVKYKEADDKRFDTSSLAKKLMAWVTITEEYNARFHNQRTVKQLRKLWDNIKSSKKTELASNKLESRGAATEKPNHDLSIQTEKTAAGGKYILIGDQSLVSITDEVDPAVELLLCESHVDNSSFPLRAAAEKPRKKRTSSESSECNSRPGSSLMADYGANLLTLEKRRMVDQIEASSLAGSKRIALLRHHNQVFSKLLQEEQRLKVDLARHSLEHTKRMNQLQYEFQKKKNELELQLLEKKIKE